MKYLSTRGAVSGLSFEEALCSGFVEDGGILMPESVPAISLDTLKSWRGLSYSDLAKQIVPMFVAEDEIPEKDLFDLIDVSVTKIKHPDVAPIAKLSKGLNILELFHGVTWAFKDLPLSFVGTFLSYFLQKRKKHITILVATSGDTGSAAVEAVRGLDWIDIICLFPKGRCTKIQELQMVTVTDDNVHVYRAEDSSSDSLDGLMKDCFADVEFAQKHNLASINSINWARIMMQIVHYFYCYLQICDVCGEEIEIVVPTGGCGNLTAGCFARKMGLPIKIVCTLNKNDGVARIIEKGDYSLEPVKISLAPAMDIQLILNIERIWYLFSDGDSLLVSQLMKQLEATGKTHVPEPIKQKIQLVVSTFVVEDEVIKKTMKRCYEENNYLICPHTATAVTYHYDKLEKTRSDEIKGQICIATASPLKFEECVRAAGLEVHSNESVLRLQSLPVKCLDLLNNTDRNCEFRKKIEEITNTFLSRNLS